MTPLTLTKLSCDALLIVYEVLERRFTLTRDRRLLHPVLPSIPVSHLEHPPLEARQVPRLRHASLHVCCRVRLPASRDHLPSERHPADPLRRPGRRTRHRSVGDGRPATGPLPPSGRRRLQQ